LQQVQMKLNIAMDAVINDYLAHAGMDIPEMAVRGYKYIGEDAAFLTVRDVYDMLPDQPQQQCDSCGGTGEKPKEEGDEEGETCPDCGGHGQMGDGSADGRGAGAFDSHDWLWDPDAPQKMADAIDRLRNSTDKLPSDVKDKMTMEGGGETEDQKRIRQAGTEEGNKRRFQEVHGLSMAWVKLLQEVDPNVFKQPGIGTPPRARWYRRPRKLASPALRKSNLPVYEKTNREDIVREKPAIVLALDYSGSIGPGDADRFATLARSIPRERIHLFACTFTTTYEEFDIDDPHGGGSGGTDFSAIGQFIEEKVRPELKGKYPKAVVVITDGCASFNQYRPDEKEAESWHWLMSPDGSGTYYNAANEIGRKAMLEDYIIE
jgi:predicted metal-dependent peptidase